MKIDPNVLKKLGQTYGVAPVDAKVGVFIKQSIEQGWASELTGDVQNILIGSHYTWDESKKCYTLGNQSVYGFDTPQGPIILWIWDNVLVRVLKTMDQLFKWIAGNDKYPDGKANSFMKIYAEMTGQKIGGGAPPKGDRGEGGGDIEMGEPAERPGNYEPKKVDPTDALIAKIKKEAGPNGRLPSDKLIAYGLQAKKDKNQKLLDFLKTIKILKENFIKKSDLSTLLREIVKGVLKETDENEAERRLNARKYKDSSQFEYVEKLANRLWPDPTDIGKDRFDKWRSGENRTLDDGSILYKLIKTKTVKLSRFLWNKGKDWFYLDPKQKKWKKLEDSTVLVPHPPLDDSGEEGYAEEQSMTGAVAPVTGPAAFSKKKSVDEMTTTGAVTGYNVPAAFSKKGGSKAGVEGSEHLGFKLTPIGRKEMERSADKLYEHQK